MFDFFHDTLLCMYSFVTIPHMYFSSKGGVYNPRGQNFGQF